MADLARVECAITQSYHAADNIPLGPEAFATIAPDDIAQLRFTLHPALNLVVSRFPIATLWQMNSGQAEPAPLDDAPAQTALIHRLHYTVSVQTISAAGGTFLNALQAGQTLGEATEKAMDRDAAFDLTAHLRMIITKGLITAFTLNRSPQ
jgi:hypothetical protein